MAAQSSGDISENSGKCRTDSALWWRTLRKSHCGARGVSTFPLLYASTRFSLNRWYGRWCDNLTIARRSVLNSASDDRYQISEKANRRGKIPQCRNGPMAWNIFARVDSRVVWYFRRSRQPTAAMRILTIDEAPRSDGNAGYPAPNFDRQKPEHRTATARSRTHYFGRAKMIEKSCITTLHA